MRKITLVIRGEARIEVPNMASVPSSTFEIRMVGEGNATLIVNGNEVDAEPEFLDKIVKLLTNSR